MSIDDNELERRRSEAWLELRDSEPNQVKIGKLVGLSQPTVSRAIAIAEGRSDGPYTKDMNAGIDGYIRRRDEIKAELEREREEEEKRDEEERICREEEELWEKLWEWVDFDLSELDQENILRRHRIHNPGKTLTEDEELAVLVRYLVRQPGRTAPPVDITKSLELLTPTSTPVQPEPVARPEELPRKSVAAAPQRTSGTPVRRNAPRPRRSPSPWVRSKSGIFPWLFAVCGMLLAAVAIVLRSPVNETIETLGQQWRIGQETWLFLGAIVFFIISLSCLVLLPRKDESAEGALRIMKLSALLAMFISIIIIFALLYVSIDTSYVDKFLDRN